MIDGLKGQLASLDSYLTILHKEESQKLVLSKKAILKIREYCRELSLLKLKYEFQNKQEEVYFFKELKVVLFSKLFYYTDVLHIESQKPIGGDKVRRKYFKEQCYRISEHFNNHRFLYQYYREGQTGWDEKYFTQIKRFDDKYDVNGDIVQCDDDYSSTHDILFARIAANDLLEVYLMKELEKASGYKNAELSGDLPIVNASRRLKWTDSKAALTEFVYALISAKSINDGKVDVKEVMEFVETIFGIDTGDFYRTYVELRSRNNRTKYLDRLRNALIERMDDDDEKGFDDSLANKH